MGGTDMEVRNRVKELRMVVASELRPSPRNWRTHPQAQQDALRGLLTEIGYADALLARETPDGLELIDGHLRAETTPDAEVPVLILDVTADEADKLLLTIDPLAGMAGCDAGKLAELRASVSTRSEAVRAMLDDLAKANGLDKPAEVVEDDVPEPAAEPVSRRGDLWVLGGHRLLCGDSTDAGDVAMCVETRADLCFTSPPYNAGGNPAASNLAGTESKYIGDADDRPEVEYLAFLRSFTDAAMDVCAAAVVNIQMLAGNKRPVLRWLDANAARFVDMAIWDKPSAPPQMAANVLNSQHELLVVMAAGPNPSKAIPFANWHGDVGSVYRGAGQKDRDVAALHAATMPIHLPLWVMQVLCPLAEVIYEPFCGSGTTLVAAAQVGRICRAIDIEPRYVDVAVRRWQRLTGMDAVLDGDGDTWRTVAAKRGVQIEDGD